MGRTLSLPVTVPVGAARARLSDFLRRRRQLVEMRKAEKLRRHSAGQDEIAARIDAMRDRMRIKGNAPKTILIAVARQLLVILNAMVRKGLPIALTRTTQLPPRSQDHLETASLTLPKECSAPSGLRQMLVEEAGQLFERDHVHPVI